MALQSAVKPSSRLLERCYSTLNSQPIQKSGHLKRCCPLISAQSSPLSTRFFTTTSSTSYYPPFIPPVARCSDSFAPPSTRHLKHQPRRSFSSSTIRSATLQEAHGSSITASYIASAGELELVNVKKVLVIGSGGLSIGQAGEFDYSGVQKSAAAFLSVC